MPDTLVHGVDIYVPIPEWRVLNWLRRWEPSSIKASVTAVLNYNNADYADLKALLMRGQIDGSYTGTDVRDNPTLLKVLTGESSSKTNWTRIHLKITGEGIRWTDGPLNQVLYTLTGRFNPRGTKVSDLFSDVDGLDVAHLLLLHEVELIRLDLRDGNESPDLSIDRLRKGLPNSRAKITARGRTLIAH